MPPELQALNLAARRRYFDVDVHKLAIKQNLRLKVVIRNFRSTQYDVYVYNIETQYKAFTARVR
jgi:hypothetical protein